MLWAIIMHSRERKEREREIKGCRQKGGPLNLFNDALYIDFLGLVVHQHAAVTDFLLPVLTTDTHNHIGLFWTFTVMLPAYRSHSLFSV